jgi:hypothetical protein
LSYETFEDAVDAADKDQCVESFSNGSNEVDLLYFARVINHYLQLVRKIPDKTHYSR